MKKLLLIFSLSLLPLFATAQVDLHNYHDGNRLWEMADSNFDEMFNDIISNQANIINIITNISSVQTQILTLQNLMDSTFVESSIDSLYVIYKLIVPVLSSAPENPVLGQIYYNTVDNDLWLWDGNWEILDGD